MRIVLCRLMMFGLVSLFSVFFISCNSSANGTASSSQPLQAAMVASQKDRVMTPDTSSSDLDELVEGNSAFAFNLYGAIRDGGENLICSPYSISLALAMTYAGAKAGTEQQMAETLHLTLPKEDVHRAFNALDLELKGRGEGAEGVDGEGFRLNIANSIWGQTGYTFLAEFLDTLAENYGAGLRLLDFADLPEESRATINDWVSDKTEQKIKYLLPPGSITSLTRLVLTNAIYFNAAWDLPFDEKATRPGGFHLLNGTETTVDMMSQVEHFKYAEGSDYQAIELPYDGRELSMVVFIPREGRFEEFEGSFTAARFESVLAELSPAYVSLAMPRFTFEHALDLGQILAKMGMPDAFDPRAANFSGMNGSFDLFISKVLHKAFIAVDEEGTEAAAATAVVMRLTAAPQEPIQVMVDRPFLFIIRDVETKAILFMGRVVDPEA